MSELRCRALNAGGEQCGSVLGIEDGLCHAHRPGGVESLRAAGSLGGVATAAKHASAAFTPEDLEPIVTLEDAMKRLDVIQSAVLTRRITHGEGNAAAKVLDSWIKAHGAHLTSGLVNELRAELDAKTREIETLRKELANHTRSLRVAK
jgi:uncharacterized protein involved in exopolysaccharide biosynthesis